MPATIIPFPGSAAQPSPSVGRRPRLNEPATLRLRVALADVEPEIWREVLVASTVRLDQLHTVLQLALGWTDSHLHQWVPDAPGKHPGWPPERFVMDPREEEDGPCTSERDVRLDELFREPGDRIWYQYDFGDGWEHTVTLVSSTPGAPKSAQLMAGENACPPEDIGGPGTYQELLSIGAGRGNENDGWLRELFAANWPDGAIGQSIDIEAINRILALNPASVREAAEPWRRGLHPGLQSVIDRLSHGPRESWVRDALGKAIAGAAPVDPGIAEQATRQLLWLLDYVGGGLTLTSAKYLKPADVRAIAGQWELAKSWIGKFNREVETPPLLQTREALQRYGLLRAAKGRLTLTRAATQVRADPVALWNLLAAKVPGRAKGYELDATYCYLLAVAAGARSALDKAAESMKQLGWRSSVGEYDRYSALHDAGDVIAIIERLEWAMGDRLGRRGEVSGVGTAFVYAALAGPRS